MAALSPTATRKIESLQRSSANARSKVRELEHGLVRKSVISLTGAGLALGAKKAILPVSVGGVPTKVVLALGATLVEAMSRGGVRRIAGAIGDASLAVYTHEAIQAESWVAGDELE